MRCLANMTYANWTLKYIFAQICTMIQDIIHLYYIINVVNNGELSNQFNWNKFSQ